MKDKLWFFTSARYFSVNNFIANTFMDDGSQGIDDQFIKNAMARLTWQVSPRNKISAYFDEIDKYRGHDMQSNYDPETAAHGVELAGVSHHRDQVDLAGDQLAVPRSGLLEQHRVLHQRIPRGHREAGGTAEWYRTAAKNELDLGGYTQAGPINTTESPMAFYWNAAATYVTGAHTIKFGANNRLGHVQAHPPGQRRPDPAVPQHAAVNAVPGCASDPACVVQRGLPTPC